MNTIRYFVDRIIGSSFLLHDVIARLKAKNKMLKYFIVI